MGCNRGTNIRRPTGFGFVVAVALFISALSGTLAGQQSGAEKSSGDTEILFLGTAGGPPLHEDRSEPATLLIVDGRRYLIDCGIGTIRRLVKAGIPSETIKDIFFTHLHPDHALGLADVMANDYHRMGLSGSAHAIDVYGPPQSAEFVRDAFRYISVPYSIFAADQPRLGDPFHSHEIEREGVVFHDDKIRVVAAENSHYALMPAKFRIKTKSYSYRFETPHGVVVFTGDTGPSEAVVRLAKGADVLVTEASGGNHERTVKIYNERAKENHWTPERTKAFLAHMTEEHLDLEHIAELASKAQVKAVILYHYYPTDPAAYVGEVKKSYSGPVFAPADLDRYCLGANSAGDKTNAAAVTPCSEVPAMSAGSSETAQLHKEQPRTLLAIFAHPDDETWVGPVLAHYARTGAKVYLAIATKGEKGTNNHAGIPAGDQLAAVRQDEAICACRQLGIEPPIFLGFINDELDTGPGHEGEQKMHSLAQRVRELITKLQPEVVITWGPEGGYGHRDHRVISDAVTEVVESESTGPRLYYVGFTEEQAALLDGWAGQWASVAADYLATNVPFGPQDRDAYHRAVECHKSQFTVEGTARLEHALDQGWNGKVSFRAWGGGPKSQDLFH